MSDGDGSQPARRVLVLGSTPIARAVAEVGAAVGYEVLPFDAAALEDAALEDAALEDAALEDAALEERRRPEVAAVVLASHGGPGEDAALRAALAAGVPYIGLVASRARGEGVVDRLGLDEAARVRIHTPAGLDIGAGTPEEVALAILAEVVASRPRVPGQSRAARGAREDRTAVHGRSSLADVPNSDK